MAGRTARQMVSRLRSMRTGAAGLMVSGAIMACLNDAPTKVTSPTVRASLSASVASVVAGGTVRIRIGYRNGQQAFVALPSSPEQISVAAGTSTVLPVTVDIGPCLADGTRLAAEAPGCVLTVELTLTDGAGTVLDRQTRDARSPASPGQSVDFGSVTIGVVVSTIAVAPTSLGMNVSDEKQLTATVRDANGAVTTTPQVTWATSDATVAALTPGPNGSVTVRALKLGTASVTAAAGGKTSAPVTVTVAPPAPLVITQRPGQGCAIVGQTLTLDVTSPPGPVAWSSGDPNVATITAAGVVTGVASGQTVVSATSGNRSGTLTVCVTGPLRVSNPNLSVTAGRTVQIATSGATGGSLTYTSSAPAIATVDGNGLVRGVGLGQAIVTATLTAASGTQSVPVQVAVGAAAVAVSPTSATAAVNGGAARFTATPLDANGAALPPVSVSWTISDPSIGALSTTSGTSVDVRALKLGAATVRATLGTATASAQFTSAQSLPAVRLEKVSGDGVTCPTRSTTCTFVVRAVDTNGVPVPGAAVTWSSNTTCGPFQSLRTDAFGLSTASNICANVPTGAYTQTASLASAQFSVSFSFSLRGLVLQLQSIDSYTGAYIYSVTSPSGPATGLDATVDYRSGPASDYVSSLTLTSKSTPATLTVDYYNSQLPIGSYVFDVIVSTTTTGLGPGSATISFSTDSLGYFATPNDRARATSPSVSRRTPR